MLQRTFFFLLLILAGCSSAPTLLRWEPIGAPYAQNVSTLHVDVISPTTLHAGLTNGDIFRSANEGGSWTLSSSIGRDAHVHKIAQHADRPSTLFAATDAGLYISRDAGETWSEATTDWPTTSLSCRSVVIDPFDSNTILAGLDGSGLHRSSDGGETWGAINGGLDPDRLKRAKVFDIVVDRTSPDIVYAALSILGVVKSTDRGNSWQPVTQGYAASGTIPTHILVNQTDGKTLCFGTASGDLFRSVDGGTSWSPTRRSTPYGSRILSLTADPSDARTIYAGTESGVLLSNDFGGSWRRLSAEMPRIPTSLVASGGTGQSVLYAFGQGTGVQRSGDGGATWNRADNALGGAGISVVTTDRDGANIYVTTGSSVYKQTTGTGTWHSVSDGLTGGTITSLAFDSDSALILYAATETEMFKGVDGGRIWFPFALSLRVHPPHFVATHPSIKTRLFASGTEGMHTSTNRGQTWSPASPRGSHFAVRSLSFHPSNAAIAYGATSNRGVIASTNGGVTWGEARYGLPEDNILAVTPDRMDQKMWYAWSTGGNGFRTIDGGLSWTRFAPPWNTGERVFVTADYERPFDAVALVSAGFVYYSPNGGGSWFQISVEQLKEDPTSLHWNASTASLYVGTKSSGVYRLSLAQQVEDVKGE